MYVYGPSLRDDRLVRDDPAVNRFMSHMVGTKNHSFSGFLKVSNGFGKSLHT